MGTPNHLSTPAWEDIRNVVAGRLVNCYSRKDLILSLMFQFKRLSGVIRPVCGNGPVNVHQVEDVDVTHLINSHSDYCLMAGQILRLIQHGQPLLHPIVTDTTTTTTTNNTTIVNTNANINNNKTMFSLTNDIDSSFKDNRMTLVSHHHRSMSQLSSNDSSTASVTHKQKPPFKQKSFSARRFFSLSNEIQTSSSSSNKKHSSKRTTAFIDPLANEIRPGIHEF